MDLTILRISSLFIGQAMLRIGDIGFELAYAD